MKEATKTQRKLPEQGTQPARCFAIIDLGNQPQVYQGIAKDPAPEIIIFWELTKFMVSYKEGGKPEPLIISQKYSWTSGEKAKLPLILKTWAKRDTPLPKLTPAIIEQFVGKYCMLSVEHKVGKDGTKYANIAGNGRGVSPFMSEVKKPAEFHKGIFFNLDKFTWDQFKELPEYAQKLIRKSVEWPSIIAKSPEPVAAGEQTIDAMADEEGGIVTDDGSGDFNF